MRRDDVRQLPEWLAYHALPSVGVGHFYLYTVDSTKDELASVAAPLVARGSVTVHALGTIMGGAKPPGIGSCCVAAASSDECRVIAHAIRHHGTAAQYLAFVGVDDYLLLGPGHVTLAGYLETQLRAPGVVRIGAVAMLQERPHQPDTLLLQATTRFLRQPPELPATRIIVRPSQASQGTASRCHSGGGGGGGDGSGGAEPNGTSMAPSAQLRLLRFGLRADHAASGPAASSAAWASAVVRALEAEKRGGAAMEAAIGLEPGLLRFATDVYRSIATTWGGSTGAPTLGAAEPLLAAAQRMAQLRAVVLAASPRTGSTTFAGMGFAQHPKFQYWFEPCRQGGGAPVVGGNRIGQVVGGAAGARAMPTSATVPSGSGRPLSQPTQQLHGSRCASRALEALTCRLSLDSFVALSADIAVMRQSSLGLGDDALDTHSVVVGGVGVGGSVARRTAPPLRHDTRLALRYERMTRHCWRSHRAVKLVRLGDASVDASPLLPLLHVIELIRHPAHVVRSRLSLVGTGSWDEFNPQGGGEAGVVTSVCAGLAAQLERGARKSQHRRVRHRVNRLEDFTECPVTQLADLYAWLGVGPVPHRVQCRVQCTCADDGSRRSKSAPRYGVRWTCGGGGGGGGGGDGGGGGAVAAGRPSLSQPSDRSNRSDDVHCQSVLEKAYLQRRSPCTG